MNSLLPEFIEDVAGDASDVVVLAAEAVAPVGSADRDDGSLPGVGSQYGVAEAALLPLFVPFGIVRVPLRRAGGQHFEILRRPIPTGR